MTKRMTKGKLEKLRLADVAAKEAWFDAYEVNCKAHQAARDATRIYQAALKEQKELTHED